MQELSGVGGVAGLISSAVFVIFVTACSADTIVVPTYNCPVKFYPIRGKCYHFSQDQTTWQDAHYQCLNMNSTLAIVTRSQQELQIRQYLKRFSGVLGNHERWIGGRFNWKQGKWVWGATGQPLIFQAFSRMNPNLKDEWKWHCIIMDPIRQNKWSARNCVLKRHYLCQTSTNKYLVVKQKLKDDNSTCADPNISNYERQVCLKLKDSEKHNAPGLLVQKPKKITKIHPPYTDYICSETMILVGRKCYFFSKEKATWNDAYWACRDNKTKLAIISSKIQDNILRGFLNGNFVEKHERWIGGIYDWKQNKWKWAMNGQELKYRNFARSGEFNEEHNCLTLDPYVKNQWNSRNRFEKLHYICQAKAKTLERKPGTLPKLRPPDATVIINTENNRFNNEVVLRDAAYVMPSPTTPKYL